MALNPCEECGKSISDMAASCPSCGCPQIQKKEVLSSPVAREPQAVYSANSNVPVANADKTQGGTSIVTWLVFVVVIIGGGLYLRNILNDSDVGSSSNFSSRWQKIADNIQNLEDGRSFSYSLSSPGRYRARITATNDGASLSWVGTSCKGKKESKSFSSECYVKSTGQLVVKNPSTFGLGSSTTVTVLLEYNPK